MYEKSKIKLLTEAYLKIGFKFFIIAFFVVLHSTAFSQTTIWLEDFPYTDGAIQGSGTPPKWTRDVSDCTLDPPDDYFEVRSNQMEGRDLDGEAIWTSETIDISSYSDVSISTNVSESGKMETVDYIRFYYKIDGGAETLFSVNGDNSDDFDPRVASTGGLNGNNLIIVVRVYNNQKNERYRFDNMLVEEPIAGDICVNAISITEVTDLAFNTSTLYTASGENPGCGGGTDPIDIWYAYTPSSSGTATFDLCGSSYDSRLGIYDACGGSVLACNDNNGPACSGWNASIEMSVTSGTTYYIQVGGNNANTGAGDLTISLIPTPANDICANALSINEVSDLPFSTINANASGENPGCGGTADPIDIWYAYTATQTGSAVFSLCGSDYDTRIAVWDACGGSVLACNENAYFCSYNDQNSILTMNVVTGSTYYVQVGGEDAITGDGYLSIFVTSTTITNDECANAISVNGPSLTPYTTVSATAGGLRPSCLAGTDVDPIDIWFSYTAATTGVVNIGLCDSYYDSQIAVYDACGGAELACNDDDGPGCPHKGASVQVSVTAASTYYIQVFGWDGATGNGDLSIELVQQPTNDDCANAIAINEVTDEPFTTTVNATAGGDNPGCGGATDPVDIWYAYTPTAAGIAHFDLCDSPFDTRLAIWDACSGTVLACNDDNDYCSVGSAQSYISMQVSTSTTYYVQVGGKNAATGTGDLTIVLTPLPTNDDCANAIAINEVTDLGFTTTAGVTTGGDNPGCGGGTNPLDIWYAYTPTATGLALFDLCGSNFNTRIALWDACGGTVLACNDDNGPGCTGTNASLEYNVSTGNTYYVQVGGNNASTGDGDLSIGFVSLLNGQWIGVVDSDWDTPGNWVNGVIPNALIDTRIINTPPNFPEVDETANCKNLFVDVNDSITINTGSLFSADGDFSFNGVFIINDGTFSLSEDLVNNGTFNHNGGTLIFNGATQSVIGSSTTPNAFYSVTVASGSTTTLANSGSTLAAVLKVDGTINTGDDLLLKSTASQTALVDGSGTGSISGEISMERYLPSGFGYHYVSSPYTSATANEYSPYVDLGASFPPLYKYDENNTNAGVDIAGWVNYSVPANILNPQEGYALNFGATTTALTFEMTGVVSNGALATLTLYNHDQTHTQGFNLVGNPYPSPIDWDAASGWTRTNIDDAVYYFDPSSTDQYGGTYGSYVNGVSSDGIANAIIPAMQAFFIHVTDGTYPVTASYGTNNSVRVNNLSPTYHKKTKVNADTLLRLCADYSEQSSVCDPVVIYFNTESSANFKKDRDALKLLNSDFNVPNLSAISSNGIDLSIFSRSFSEDSITTVPLSLKTKMDALVSFYATKLDLFPYDMQIYLRDTETGIYHDLRLNGDYQATVSAGDHRNRFSVVFSQKDLRYQPKEDELYYSYCIKSTIHIYSNTPTESKADVALINISGQQVWEGEIYGNGYHEINVQVNSGIYILRLSSVYGFYTNKLLIFN